MRNRGIARGRIFFGALLLLSAVITWATAALLSPHGTTIAEGPEHVRATVVTFLRNSAIGTLLLSALSAWLLFGTRRPRRAWLDWAIGAVLLFLVGTSLYQLAWLYLSVEG